MGRLYGIGKSLLKCRCIYRYAKLAGALAACNKVASGGFTLHPATANATSPLGNTYYELFGDVCPNDETIFALYLTENIVSGNIILYQELK
jgi:hypothetical protein